MRYESRDVEYAVIIRIACAPPNKRVKLAARPLRGRIAFVRPSSSVKRSITGVPGRAGRRSLRAFR